MAVEVAAQVVWLAKWFHDELRANPGVKGEVKEVAECVDRWSAVLQSGAGCKVLDNPRGLHHAHPVLHHVCQCLHDAKVFYEKYKHGWGKGRSKWWITPSRITEKAKDQKLRLQGAFQELIGVLSLETHAVVHDLQMVHAPEAPAPGVGQPQAPQAVAHAGRETSEWEIKMQNLTVERSGPSQPVSILGKGQTGGSVVGEGSYSDDSGNGPSVPVAVKMATAVRLQRPGVCAETEFQKEVRLLWRLSHANIVMCFGAVTRFSDGGLCLWIVMERLEQNLEDAILKKRMRLGRDDPELFASIITGLVSALAYLHTSVNGVPVVHGDLQPSNILLDKHNAPKLADFGAASRLASAQGSGGPAMHPAAASPWVAPESERNVYTRASDMYVLGLLGNFVWSAELPFSHASPTESTSHLAGYALHLLRGCRNREPTYRPAAATLRYELLHFKPVQCTLALPVGMPTSAPGGLQQSYIAALREKLKLLEGVQFRPCLRRVCHETWKDEDNWRVGGITGMMDVNSHLRLQQSLWRHAGCIQDDVGTSRLVATDLATWSWRNLTMYGCPDAAGEGIVKLAGLQNVTRADYVRQVDQPVHLLPINRSCHNMLPLHDCITARDKFKLCNSGAGKVVFDLAIKVFSTGNAKNSAGALGKLRDQLCPHAQGDVQLLASPCRHVTAPEAMRISAGIPSDAVFFCFCYPLLSTSYMLDQSSEEVDRQVQRQLSALCHTLDMHDAFVHFVLSGGYVYMDEMYRVVAINSFFFEELPAGSEGEASVIHFGPYSPLPDSSRKDLKEHDRWQPVTVSRLQQMGYTHFAWVVPSEVLGGWCFPLLGGFAYLNKDWAKCYFLPIVPAETGVRENEFYKDTEPAKLRFVRPATNGVLGLNWEQLGASKPLQGRELQSAELAEALMSSTTLTSEQWTGCGIHDLGNEDYIRLPDGSYCRPADPISNFAPKKLQGRGWSQSQAPPPYAEAVAMAADPHHNQPPSPAVWEHALPAWPASFQQPPQQQPPQQQRAGTICTICANVVGKDEARMRDAQGRYTHAVCKFPHISAHQYVLLQSEMQTLSKLNMPTRDTIEVLVESPGAQRLLDEGGINSKSTLRQYLMDIHGIPA